MSSNICGNCDNFKPKPGEKLFNCTQASHAGLKYGMQVRADTRSCDAFVPFDAPSSPPTPPTEPAPVATEEQPRLLPLCSRGRMILIAALAVAVLLVSWLLYTCASALITTESTPTPTPTTTPAPTGPPAPTATPRPIGPLTPTPTPTPAPWENLDLGQWMQSSRELVTVLPPPDTKRTDHYLRYGRYYYAPSGTVYIIIDVTVTNVGVDRLYVGPAIFTLVDSTGLEITPFNYTDTDKLESSTIGTGHTMGGKVGFIVPEPVHGLKVVHTMRGIPSVRVTWQLPW